MRRALFVALLVAGPARGATAPDVAPVEKLREVEEERGKVEYYVRRVEEKKAAVLETLEAVERVARASEGEASLARRRAAAAGERLERAKAHEEDVQGQREALATEVGPRLTLRYRLRGAGYLKAMLSAPTIGDFLWRRRMVDRILESDLSLVAQLQGAQLQARAALDGVARERRELALAQTTARARADEARGRREVQAGVLKALLAEKGSYARAIGELEGARQRLLEELARLPAPPAGLGGFGARRGHLPMPTDGTVDVTFGNKVDPAHGTVLQQKGVDIKAVAGRQVRAPHPALVGFAGWFRGFGNLVVLDHGEGYYTLYAHLASLAVARGDRVGEGDGLGAVGETGSLKGPYLYFEVRSAARALDPAEWLQK